MKILRVFVPGDFEDAYLYMGWLTLLTSTRSLRMYNVERVTALIDGDLPGSTPIAQYFFARNDWLQSAPFKNLMSNAEVSTAFWDAVGRFPPDVSVDRYLTEPTEQHLDLRSDVVLDLRYYGGRLYLAANDGLYDLTVDWQEPHLLEAPRRRLDAPCLSVSAGFGTVNASCGSNGLFSGMGELDNMRERSASEMVSVASESVRTGWLHYDLVNYASNSRPSLHTTTHEPSRQEADGERQMITQISHIPFSLTYLLGRVEEEGEDPRDDIQFVFNSNNTIFVNTYRGRLLTLRLAATQLGHPPQVRFSSHLEGAGTRILSAHWCRSGVVFETDERVLLLADGERYVLLDSPVLSVRAFATSKRYQNLVTATTEQGVWLISAVRD